MTRDEAKEYVKTLEPDFLQKAKRIGGKQSYICPNPLCENGSGKDATGITRDPKTGQFKCFKCGLYEDTIGLWKLYTGLIDDKEVFDSVYDHYGIVIDGVESMEYQKQDKSEREEPEVDYKDFFSQANKNLDKTDYHRGLRMETLNLFHIGYMAEWRHPKAPASVPTTPRLIIPNSWTSYLARDTRADIPEDQKEYKKSKVGKQKIFCVNKLWKATQPIFVVEGELDAISVVDVGGEAIALGSTAYWKKLLEKVKEIGKTPVQPLILALDADEDGREKEDLLADALEAEGITFYRRSITGDYKDPNEFLMADREGFSQRISEVLDEVAELESEASEAEKEAYLQTSVASHIQDFLDGIADSVNTPFIPTGFPNLDKELDGGFYEGLYIVGAISSLGKTTLLTQVGDNVAQAGTDVLIFSLEMARSELMAKSISRHTLLDVLQNNGDTKDAKTTRGITTGTRYSRYSQTEKDLIHRAVEAYSQYAGHIFIHEGIGDIGTEKIRETIKTHIYLTGKTPLVIVDYLQILSPADVRATDKQNMDRAVLELKRISRDYKLPVVAISSLNRANYKTEIDMEAFKESGAIEYSSDALIGLQFKGQGQDSSFNATEAKKRNPREVEVRILKNRNGATGGRVAMEYYTLFNYFTEA